MHNDSYLPIFLYQNTYQKIVENEVTLSYDEAYSAAKKELEERLDKLEVVDISEKVSDNGNALLLSCEAKLLIDITKEEFLLFSTTN